MQHCVTTNTVLFFKSDFVKTQVRDNVLGFFLCPSGYRACQVDFLTLIRFYRLNCSNQMTSVIMTTIMIECLPRIVLLVTLCLVLINMFNSTTWGVAMFMFMFKFMFMFMSMFMFMFIVMLQSYLIVIFRSYRTYKSYYLLERTSLMIILSSSARIPVSNAVTAMEVTTHHTGCLF